MMFLWLLLLVPLVVFLVAGPNEGGTSGYRGYPAYPPAPVAHDDTPMEIARKRLARGEITVAEYDGIRRAIGG